MPNTQVAVATLHTTRIALPTDNSHTKVETQSGVTLDFNTSEATFERIGDDLQIKADGGGTVTLTDFFVAEDTDALPVFTLADGQQVASGDFLKSLSVDITTAAGPSASSAPDSGGTSYSDDTGTLVGGVDRLGSLGSDQWSQGTPISAQLETTGAVAAATSPEGPTAPPLLPDAGFPAVMRFVLFRDTPEANPEMTGLCTEAANSTQGQTVQTKYGTATIAADGTITYTFSGTPEQGALYIDYIKFTDANGKEHSVQVVVTDNPDYKDDSSLYDTAGVINREAHDGTLASGNYDATSGNKTKLGDGNDVIKYTTMDGGSLATGAGNDTITIAGAMKNSSINAGNESNSVTVGGMLGDDASRTNSIYSQGGSITVKVDNNANNTVGITAQHGGQNSILTEDATVLVDAKTSSGGVWGVDAYNGNNSITATGAGTVTVNAQGETWATGVNAEGSGSNSLTTATDKLTVTATADDAVGVYANTTGAGNTLRTDSGELRVEATGGDGHAYAASADNGSNTLASATGKITVQATSQGETVGLRASGGSNSVSTAGSAHIEAESLGTGKAHGLLATGPAQTGNTVNAGTIDIHAIAGTGGADALHASGGATNTVTSANDVSISAKSAGGNAIGLNATGSSANTVVGGAGGVVSIDARSTATTGGNAWALYANNDARNTITAADGTRLAEVNITATTNHAGAGFAGLDARSGGSNTITNADAVTILANRDTTGTAVTGTGSGRGSGVYVAEGGTNTIGTETAKAGTVEIRAGSISGPAYGIHAESSVADKAAATVNTINATGKVTVDVTSEGNAAYGMKTGGVVGSTNYYGGTNSITTTGDVAITSRNTGSGLAYGLHAELGGLNEISAKGIVSIDAASANYTSGVYAKGASNTLKGEAGVGVTATGSNATTVYAASGTNTLESALGKVSVIATAGANGNAFGVSASGGTNVLTAATGIDIAATGNNAYALYAGLNTTSGSNTLKSTEGTVTINATAGSGSAYGVFGYGSSNEITNTRGDIIVNALSGTGGYSVGLNSSGVDTNAASNTLQAGGTITINTAAHSSAAGIETSPGKSTNTLKAGQGIAVNVTSETSSAQGIWNLSTTELTAENGNVALDVQGQNARGIHNGSMTNLTAKNGNVLVHATSTNAAAQGVYTISTGVTTLKASGLVDVQAHTTDAGATTNTYGLYTESQNPGQQAKNILIGNSVKVEASTNSGNVYAMYTNTGLNTITSDTTVTVRAENAGTGSTYGMYAISTNNKTGDNNIQGTDVKVESLGGTTAYGLAADGNRGTSTNRIDADGHVEITAKGNATTYGLMAKGGSGTANNIVNGANVDITAQSTTTTAYGLWTGGSVKSQNIVTAENDGLVTITVNAGMSTVNSLRSWAIGMSASGTTQTTDATAPTNKVHGNLDIVAHGQVAAGVHSTDGGTNIIGKRDAGDDTAYDVRVNAGYVRQADGSLVKGTSTETHALYSLGGKNTIDTKGTILLNSYAESATNSASATGVYTATFGTNTIRNADSLTIHAEGNNTSPYATSSNGVYTIGSNATSASTAVFENIKDISIEAVAQGNNNSSTGVTAYGGGTNSINSNAKTTVANSVTVSATTNSTGTAKGVYASSSASKSTNAIGNNATTLIDITATASKGAAYGLDASKNAENMLTGGEVKVAATSATSKAYGLSAADGGKNTINTTGTSHAGNVTILANLKDTGGVYTPQGGASAYGLYASGGTNTIDAKGTVTIGAGTGVPTTTAFTSGLYAMSGGANKITAVGDINVTVAQQGTGGAAAYLVGLNVDEKGNNILKSSGSVGINVSSDGSATGIRNYKGSEGTIASSTSVTAGKDVNLVVTGRATSPGSVGALGMEVWGSTSSITAKDGTINVDITSTNTGAKGLSAWSGGNNILDGKHINISVEGHETSYPGAGTYVAAVGLGANGIGAKNTLVVGESLHIDVSNDQGGTSRNSAIGLSASNGGVNTIQAAGSHGIEVHISVAAGSGGRAFALYASKDASGQIGTNQIIGGAGNDFINIKGDIYSDGYGRNIIDLSKGGNNTVILDGIVSKNGLTLVSGPGHDTLILKAGNKAEFDLKFKTWLTDLYKNGIDIEDIKLVVASDMSDADRANYLQYVQGLFPAGDRGKISLLDDDQVPTSAAPAAAPAAASFEESGDTSPSPASAPLASPTAFSRMAFAATELPGTTATPEVQPSSHEGSASNGLLSAPLLAAAMDTAEHNAVAHAAVSQTPETAQVAEQPAHVTGDTADAGANGATTLAQEQTGHETTGDMALANNSPEETNALPAENTEAATTETEHGSDTLSTADLEGSFVPLAHENDLILLNDIDSDSPFGIQSGSDTLILTQDEANDVASTVPGLSELWNELAASQDDTLNEQVLEQVFTTTAGPAPLGVSLNTIDAAFECTGLQEEGTAAQSSCLEAGQAVFDAYQHDTGADTLSLFMQQTVI